MDTTSIEAGPELTDRDLMAIARLVYEKSGIRLHRNKRALVTARLQRRVRQGGFRSFHEYMLHVKADASGAELTALLDAIATNHTSFFREPQHFAFLRDVVVRGLVGRAKGAPVHGWSAACATGEEPYGIAMTLAEAFGGDVSRARIVATDLSTKALAVAVAGIYKDERVATLPPAVLHRHFERGVGDHRGFWRVAPDIRRAVEFRQANLLEAPPAGSPFDFIFCRNVMIYFDQAAQQRVVAQLEQRLTIGGYLFISHAESLNGLKHALAWVAPAVYRRVTR